MKLWPRVWCLVFFDSRCISSHAENNSERKYAENYNEWHNQFIFKTAISIFTSHGPVSVCLSVSVSVCHKQNFLLKRQNVGSHKQLTNTRYPRDSSFLMPKISAKFDRGHPYEGAECRWGGSKSVTFDQ